MDALCLSEAGMEVSARQLQQDEITIFMGDLAMGGAERVFVMLSRQFLARGYQVRFVLASKSGPLLDELDPAVKIVDLQAHKGNQSDWLFGVRALCKLVFYFRECPPKVLLTTLTGANLMAILARILSCRRFRLVIREAVTLANVRSRVRLWAMRLLYREADAVVVLTEHMKTQLVQRLRLNPERLKVIKNSVDVDHILSLSKDRTEWEDIRAMRPYCIGIGRLVEQKDFDTLIRAMAKLRRSPLRLVVLGEGPQRAELEGLIRNLNMEDRVFLLGFRANPYPWLASATGFVLSSRWEGYPNVLLEAKHFQLPVVASNYDDSVVKLLDTLPACPYRLVPVGDPDAMATAMDEIIIRREGVDSKLRSAHDPMNSRDPLQEVVDLYLDALLPGKQIMWP